MAIEATSVVWQVEETSRTYRTGDHPGQGEKGGGAWLDAVRETFPAGGGHLDLGCGAGRMTFALADRWRQEGWSIGADRDEDALREARARAEREGLNGARFIRMDVEKENYEAVLPGHVPDLITAHLCMGTEIIERAAGILPAGGVFAGVALHPDLWKEAGRASRFAMTKATMENLLHRFGLSPIFLRLEKEVVSFASAGEALEGYFQNGGAVARWQGDGRWETLQKYFSAGGRTVTSRARVQCIARKRPA